MMMMVKEELTFSNSQRDSISTAVFWFVLLRCTYFLVAFKGRSRVMGVTIRELNGIISTETVKSSTRGQFQVIQEGKK